MPWIEVLELRHSGEMTRVQVDASTYRVHELLDVSKIVCYR
eukprot:SAG31_NODE_40_length_31360_cov_6.751575_2_plen_41_part_00